MNLTKITETYIRQHPSIKDCLKNDTINFSKLAREIIHETDLKERDFDAVLVACRRYRDSLRKKQDFGKSIISILKKSKVEIKNKMMVTIVEKDVHSSNLLELAKIVKKTNDVFHIIEGATAVTLITSDEYAPEIEKLMGTKVISQNKQLIEIIIKSSQDLEETPGVVAYLYSLFGEYGINIVETMSCWTDTIFVVHEKDLVQTMELLKF